ncbi:helix-turn-helix domain-containing protein [Cronobacter sakazakii]|uniref:helix-turn-helix domain-containing protein n=1 Tax=Cronobacter sakazakii TaxID=28141 RepID=UPI0009BB86C3|nr:helix-turn-helix domain-containing protein [Cronobacter sakazakii]EKK7732418.1 helix-turn-helix domain-containing protein [Cronobacter sakazakii]ELY2717219.1 helix-turn-helix domain-containing protein [Cronobacter sakazakii]ELY3619148.1 helix-turn-helix domain-containing protein [Cronobacter sakazakii]EMA8649201.1 helix-turn-helix domain-containing protein [Cronobacter sakazakii]PUX68365.1 helix-turn-helix domain-containing protein [Cronobacter sakazakii]
MKPMSLHERIAARRKELGLAQQKLADMVGRSHVTVYRWETGDAEPKGKNLFALSNALRCSPAWLLFGDEDKQPEPPNEATSVLDAQQQRMLQLFDALPDSEKESIINELEARVDNFNRLFDELLKVRKKQNSLKK